MNPPHTLFPSTTLFRSPVRRGARNRQPRASQPVTRIPCAAQETAGQRSGMRPRLAGGERPRALLGRTGGLILVGKDSIEPLLIEAWVDGLILHTFRSVDRHDVRIAEFAGATTIFDKSVKLVVGFPLVAWQVVRSDQS